MWKLIIRYPGQPPRQIKLTPGVTTIGRRLDSDIVLSDTAVSRCHAEIEYNPENDALLLHDLGSANGSFVNLKRLERGRIHPLGNHDLLQVGSTEINVIHYEQDDELEESPPIPTKAVPRQHPPKLLDDRTILLYEVARQLNTVLDTETALHKVSHLMKGVMGADKCEVILANQFDQLRELGFSVTIASMALEQRLPVVVPNEQTDPGNPISDSAARLLIYSALCVPVTSGEKIIALIYLYKTDPDALPFDESDVTTAEAVSHMVALTVERMDLFQRIHEEQRLRQLLQSHLAPSNAEYLFHDYLKTGRLPGLGEQRATVLFVDIADSTRWAERLGAVAFGKVLKRYYQEMTDIVFEHDGMLDKYLGDGIMAVFGLTGDEKEADLKAVNAGLTMLNLFEERFDLGQDPMHIGVGVNGGSVVAGYINTKDRVEFTVLGEAVNIAFGLQAMARPNRLLIGPATWDAVKDYLPIKPIGMAQFKQRNKAVAVGEVLRQS